MKISHYILGAIAMIAAVVFGIMAYNAFVSGEQVVGGIYAWTSLVVASVGNALIIRSTDQ